ncbi:ferritin light chain-like [Sorex fumeus]|uniref:ferritin light chain-like n=1 Tax=Sorex fumeus TaxID=62283 RepID=UPI0024ADB75D|nr:ferritin light chain-like [Sorex fumeus]
MIARIRQGLPTGIEASISNLVNLHLQASYIYLDLGFYFQRDDVRLKDLSQFFHKLSEEKLEGVERLLKMQNVRQGRTSFQDVKRPFQDDLGRSPKVMEAVLVVEKRLNQALLDLHELGTAMADKQLCDFLQTSFIDGEMKLLEKMSLYLATVRRPGFPHAGVGEHLFNNFTVEQDKDWKP